ncbi:MAG: DUF3014 domain-containing protein [Pseudomonadales bacterium]
MTNNRSLIIGLIVAAVLVVGFLIFFSGSDTEEPTTTEEMEVPRQPEPKPEPEPEPEPEPQPEPEPEPEPEFVLPRLDNSDPLIRDGAKDVTRHEGIEQWLDREQLARKFVVVVDGLAGGNVPRDQFEDLAPKDPFKVRKVNDKVFVMEEESYRRYDRITDVITSVDAGRAAQFYELTRPLLQEAYSELGYPEENFDDVVFRAVGRLLETPVITEPIYLIQPSVMYEYQNEKLESLSPAQKQLLRMGPKNTRAIQAKLSEFARELRALLEDR